MTHKSDIIDDMKLTEEQTAQLNALYAEARQKRREMDLAESAWRDAQRNGTWQQQQTNLRHPFVEAQRAYRLLAPRLLLILGKKRRAKKLNRAIEEYLTPKLMVEIDGLLDRFIEEYYK